MIQSMTGFGKAESVVHNKKISLELRSLNSKFIDLSLKMPSLYKSKDVEIRTLLTEGLKRGKIELTLHYDLIQSEPNHFLNKTIIKDYYKAFDSITQELSLKNKDKIDFLQQIMKMPDVLKTEKKELSQKEWSVVKSLVNEAIEDLSLFRKNEGKALEKDLRSQIDSISSLLSDCEQYENQRIETIKSRLKKNLSTIAHKEDYNETRFEQELIYYIEKFDYSEEKVRLSKHCEHFIETIETSDYHGKKLGFIVQEIGREINTLGSKANHFEIQKIVVQMKDHLEKIKEQVLNIL
ncbi:MAG: YicC family protein [Flavobacteriales bacterium]|nr:YicC family protein [Flavobacteriales bacterium]